ncbi:cobaltochelatase subunit CobN [Desulfovermiculus halophilus]|uniref:cobaltochelatase subunit CobN n=1 Tax=Desulfovermiculus halophilus TaxID=339722 RepID=UPI000550AE36|nr:cobaltochelatase subunit CobN [Desulfovermiculus halophilus]
MLKYVLLILCVCALLPSLSHADEVALLVIDADSYAVNEALKKLYPPKNIKVCFFTHADIQDSQAAREFIQGSEVIVADVMQPQITDYLLENVNTQSRPVYALRGSNDDQKLKSKGFRFEPTIQAYFQNLSVQNIHNMLRRVIHDQLDASVGYDPVHKRPQTGMYHPEADSTFTSFSAYHKWYMGKGPGEAEKPWLGLMLFSSSLIPGQRQAVDTLIQEVEKAGWNVAVCFGRDEEVLTSLLLDESRSSRVDCILAFSLKFYSAVNSSVQKALQELDVPVVNVVNLYGQTISEWRENPQGIPPMHVVWTMANPEISGLIEPTPLTGPVEVTDPETGRKITRSRVITDSLDRLLPRLRMWRKLQTMPNEDKKVAVLYYNHSQGKQNIGASYLNVFRSLERILRRMQDEGYQVDEKELPGEKELKDLVLKYGRNIGSWAPGELHRLLVEGKVIRLPVSRYKKWFSRLPAQFRSQVLEQWGPVEKSSIMIKDRELIIPGFRLGNVLLLPEPARGWGDEPMKLYHDPTLQPHHQYIAAYLWLKHEFEADAMIHLGTHATYEWLPGKQAGLAPSCPPEVMLTDIPNLYPYIVDDVGEGIQAKRRGRGVIIDHLTPPLRKGGLYQEYRRLYDLINGYNRSQAMQSQTAEAKLEEIKAVTRKLGLDTDLGITTYDSNALEEIEHYLLELKGNLMPYGLHTFGRSPQGQALTDTVETITEHITDSSPAKIRSSLAESGNLEIERLLAGLEGRYIPAGEGNDPVRNPSAVPTGKNFFGFDPQKIPSRSAWKLGKKAARQMINASLEKNGTYPQKVAVVLWATETIRNEGVNESTILSLLGIKPTWDVSGRVTGTEVIPGRELDRPRIDVLINPSGLYRDLFPNKMRFLDRAVQKAAVQTDIKNLLREHSASLKRRLRAQGMTEEKADRLSTVRIFSEKSGSYGTGVSEMTGASGLWKSEQEIAEVYENRVGYAFGQGMWGQSAQEVFKDNLASVDTTVHSRSSNVYGTMDNDDMFQYLGGLSLAVRTESGQAPDTLITQQQEAGQVEVEDAAKTLGRELRTRYLNPEWIEGMKKEDYAGAREMSKFVDYMWGWQVTTPQAVDEAKWEQTYAVYVQDKYGQNVKEFMNESNPWAYQSITARMLEAVRKGYWQAEDKVKKKLAAEYALNVVDKGVACCDHTCNNPMLNQMVVNVISLPGVMSPQMVEEFKLAVEQATGQKLIQQVQAREALQQKLQQSLQRPSRKQSKDQPQKKRVNDSEQKTSGGAEQQEVTGYKMERKDKQDKSTQLASSGVQWFASLIILLIIGLFGLGMRRGNTRD